MKKHSLRCNFEERETVKYDDLEAIGYKKANLAVLNRAYRDLYARSNKLRESALEWILDDTEIDDHYITFSSVCDQLGLDPRFMRSYLTNKNEQISKSLSSWSHLNRTSLFGRNYRSVEGNNTTKKSSVR